MKKNVLTGVLILCLLLLTGSAVMAEIGFKAGVSASKLSFHDHNHHDDWDAQWRGGVQAGFFFAIPISRTVAIQPEFYYAARHNTFDNWDHWDHWNEEEDTRFWKLGYFEMPLLVKIKFPNGGVTTPNIFFGPYASLQLSARETGDHWNEHHHHGHSHDHVEVRVRDSRFGMTFGGGLDFDLGGVNLLVEARFNLELARENYNDDYYDENEYYEYSSLSHRYDDRHKNNSRLVCMIGISF